MVSYKMIVLLVLLVLYNSCWKNESKCYSQLVSKHTDSSSRANLDILNHNKVS